MIVHKYIKGNKKILTSYSGDEKTFFFYYSAFSIDTNEHNNIWKDFWVQSRKAGLFSTLALSIKLALTE